MNVIDCPHCKQVLSEYSAEFAPAKKPNTFKLTCRLCGHKWTAHHASFRRERSATEHPNPFDPINITPEF